MTLLLRNLDEKTRALMLAEVAQDVAAGTLYLSNRLSPAGSAAYPALLTEAVRSHDDAWLASQLRSDGNLLTKEQKKRPSGGYTLADVPYTAADTLAEGEFNRFYIRGLCLRVIEENVPSLVVYRAKAVTNARSESERKIGASVSPQVLLDDLRSHTGLDTALGLPPGPNSGLSVFLP